MGKLSQLKNCLARKTYADESERLQMLEECSSLIVENNMAPFYKTLCSELNIPCDQAKLDSMQKKNDEILSKFDDQLKNAEESEGETDIKKILMQKANYCINIGAKSESIETLNKVLKSSPTTDMKINCLFKVAFVHFFNADYDDLRPALQNLEDSLTSYSSWEDKNRFKVYKGLYCIAQGNFEDASKNLIETLPTFNTTELVSYENLVCYAVSVAMLILSRRDLKKKCVDGQEIQEGLYGAPLVKEFLKSLYNCRYADFFKNLALIEQELKKSFFMGEVYNIYVEDIRAVAYAQLLESYSSLSLDYMADLFAVSSEFMDEEIAYYIGKGKLNCKINKVTRTINTITPEVKNQKYNEILRQGDLLLSQLQKLATQLNV